MAVMSMKIRRRVAAAIAGTYALLVIAVAVDAWIELQTDESGLTALGLVLVTLPLGPMASGLADMVLGDTAEGLKPTLPLLLMTASGLLQAWLLWLITRGRRTSL
jgi:hypothetical protein